MNLLKEVKKYRDEMVARNYPFQAISDIITKYELDNPSVELKNDDRGPLDLTKLIEEKEKEAMSLKKATMSVQNDFKDKVIGVEYTSKKGKLIETSVKIPMGRKIRQSIILEQKRLAAKAAREARGR